MCSPTSARGRRPASASKSRARPPSRHGMCRLIPACVASKRFLVATYESFWGRYSAMPMAMRHYYEVIPEHAPCHLVGWK